jgi:hypothetical protein
MIQNCWSRYYNAVGADIGDFESESETKRQENFYIIYYICYKMSGNKKRYSGTISVVAL